MLQTISPNRAVLVAVGAFVLYWIMAMFVPALILRDVFNSLAFGAAFMIVLTWFPGAAKALQGEGSTGERQLVLAIFLVWLVVLLQRIYVITFNWMGRPEAWAESALAGFFPYSYVIGGLLFLSAPGVHGGGLERRAFWSIVAAVGVGSLMAGILIGASIPSQ